MLETSAGQGPVFSFLKGQENEVAPRAGKAFDWDKAAATVREHLSEAMNARNVAFLLGSGCSSFVRDKEQLGVPTMKFLAEEFIEYSGLEESEVFLSADECKLLLQGLGLNIDDEEYSDNLERLMEVLYSFQFAFKRSSAEGAEEARVVINSAIAKVRRFVFSKCTTGAFANGDRAVADLYENFYRKLVYRDRALPRPWVFTTNYDLFNETAMDRLSIPYCNGFSGVIERRFNPSVYRYSLAEQIDITSRKWTAVDNFVYLCKLHGSVSWIEEEGGLFPIREMQTVAAGGDSVMIYPTPAKQNASFGSPYSDLFREFQSRLVREQSVLFVVGYGFGDEHVNNIIFQAMTVPSFRMIAFVAPDSPWTIAKLRALKDPRVWLIGGEGPEPGRPAHFFDTVVEKFMPESPGNKIDTAVEKVLQTLMRKPNNDRDEADGE